MSQNQNKHDNTLSVSKQGLFHKNLEKRQRRRKNILFSAKRKSGGFQHKKRTSDNPKPYIILLISEKYLQFGSLSVIKESNNIALPYWNCHSIINLIMISLQKITLCFLNPQFHIFIKNLLLFPFVHALSEWMRNKCAYLLHARVSRSLTSIHRFCTSANFLVLSLKKSPSKDTKSQYKKIIYTQKSLLPRTK